MNKTSLLAITLTSTLFFSACQAKVAPANQQNSGKTLHLTQTNTPQKTNLPNNTQPLQKGNTPMPTKTLADFKEIAATQATLHTTQGEIVIKLFRDKAPLTTANFLNLADEGFYDGIIFHRVIKDFMAQVGDPLTKEKGKEALWGTGGPGYMIADEFDPELKHDKPGIVSMANSGPNTGGSQFFITHVATPWLDGKHAVFGEVTDGLDVLMKIKKGDKINSISFK